ncbi:hypothetical protein MRX96_023586 [Rhipicephalus microplus]
MIVGGVNCRSGLGSQLLTLGRALRVATALNTVPDKAFRIFLGQYAEWLQKIAASKTLYTQSQLFFLGFVAASTYFLLSVLVANRAAKQETSFQVGEEGAPIQRSQSDIKDNGRHVKLLYASNPAVEHLVDWFW